MADPHPSPAVESQALTEETDLQALLNAILGDQSDTVLDGGVAETAAGGLSVSVLNTPQDAMAVAKSESTQQAMSVPSAASAPRSTKRHEGKSRSPWQHASPAGGLATVATSPVVALASSGSVVNAEPRVGVAPAVTNGVTSGVTSTAPTVEFVPRALTGGPGGLADDDIRFRAPFDRTRLVWPLAVGVGLIGVWLGARVLFPSGKPASPKPETASAATARAVVASAPSSTASVPESAAAPPIASTMPAPSASVTSDAAAVSAATRDVSQPTATDQLSDPTRIDRTSARVVQPTRRGAAPAADASRPPAATGTAGAAAPAASAAATPVAAASAQAPGATTNPSGAPIGSVPTSEPAAVRAEPIVATPAPSAVSEPARPAPVPPAPTPAPTASATPALAAPAAAGASALPTRPPRLVSRAQPVQRGEALGRATTGVVTVRVSVDATGRVLSVRSLTGPLLLRDQAEDAARRSLFEPALRVGVPTASDITINYSFTRDANDVRERGR